MLIMVGYNLFPFIPTRELTYLWYVSYALFFTLLHLSINGYVAEYLWPRDTAVLPYLTPLFISVSGVFSVLFTRQILGLHTVRCLRVFPETANGNTVLPAARHVHDRCHSRPARPVHYCHARSHLQHAHRIVNLTYCGTRLLLHNFFTAYPMQIFSAAEVTLFSLALGDRLNQPREDSLNLQQVRAAMLRPATLLRRLRRSSRLHGITASTATENESVEKALPRSVNLSIPGLVGGWICKDKNHQPRYR